MPSEVVHETVALGGGGPDEERREDEDESGRGGRSGPGDEVPEVVGRAAVVLGRPPAQHLHHRHDLPLVTHATGPIPQATPVARENFTATRGNRGGARVRLLRCDGRADREGWARRSREVAMGAQPAEAEFDAFYRDTSRRVVHLRLCLHR